MAATSVLRQGWKAVQRVAIEGNIGAGKSTFLRLLKKRSLDRITLDIVPEPLSKWQQIGNDSTLNEKENLLDKFYKDPARWAYSFQTYACLSRIRAQLEAPISQLEGCPNPALFFERSVYSDRLCFALNSYQLGFMSQMEWNLYCDWHTFIVETLAGLYLDAIVYLRTEPDICFSRLCKRSRPEEKTVELSYLERLHEKHDNWLIKSGGDNDSVPKIMRRFPVLVLDGNEDFENLPEKQEEMVQELLKFLAKPADTK